MKKTSAKILNQDQRQANAKAIAKAKAKCEKIVERLPVPEFAIRWLSKAKTREDFEELVINLTLEYDVQMGQVAMDWLNSVGESRTSGEEAVYARFLSKQMLEMMEELDMYRDKAEQNERNHLRPLKTKAQSAHAKSGSK